MYVYIQSERNPPLYTVGFYKPNGEWESESDHSDSEEAAKRVRFLNGGKDDAAHRIAKLEVWVSELRHKTGITEVDELREQFDAD